MKNFLFKKIEIWLLLLLFLLGTFSVISLLWIIRSEVEVPGRFGKFGQYIIYISKFPEYVKIVVENPFKNPFLTNEPNRFKNESGLITEYKLGTRNSLPFLLINYFNPTLKIGITELVDLNTGKKHEIQKWDVEKLWKKTQVQSIHFNLVNDFPNYRFLPSGIMLKKNGTIIAHNYTPLIKSDLCGKLEILNDENLYHHSLEVDSEGNYWAPLLIEPKTNNLNVSEQREDGIAKFNSEGKILFQKSIFEIIFENGLSSILHAVNLKFKDTDPFHLNDIEPVLKTSKYWKKGDVFISLRNRSMVFLYRPSTNKIIWYKTGITSQQHDIDIISDTEIVIFDNNIGGNYNTPPELGNRLVTYNFENNKSSFLLDNQISEANVKTRYAGSSAPYSKDGIMIEESNYGRIVGISKTNNLQWKYINRQGSEKILMTLVGSRIIDRTLALDFINKRNKASCPM